MAVSLSDFATKLAAAAPPSGNLYRSVQNGDGSLTVYQALKATPGTWTVYVNKLIYDVAKDTVTNADCSGVSTVASGPYITGLP